MDKTSKNDITGDWIQSKPNNEMFGEGWDRIFGKKKALDESIKDNEELYNDLAIDKEWDQMKPVGLEYELNKSTGEVQPVTITLKPDMED